MTDKTIRASAPVTKTEITETEIAVVVTTAHRFVGFGYMQPEDIRKEHAPLRAARNCLSWSADVKGFIGLASTGPSSKCRVGPAADIFLRSITSVVKCTPEAVLAWEAAPWSR